MEAFTGIELVPDSHRLARINAMRHGIESQILQAEALAEPSGIADKILAQLITLGRKFDDVFYLPSNGRG